MITISTKICMPKPKEIKAGVQIRVSDFNRMEKIMKIYNSIFVEVEQNKMSKIWETEDPIFFIFMHKGNPWKVPVNKIHYFCSYWQTDSPKEWWISFK